MIDKINHLVRAIETANERTVFCEDALLNIEHKIMKRVRLLDDVCVRQRKTIKRMRRMEETLTNVVQTMERTRKVLQKIEGEETESDSMSSTLDSDDEVEVPAVAQ